LTSWTVCTRTDLLQDGFRSFPSGHASFSSAGMWYLILYSAASESTSAPDDGRISGLSLMAEMRVNNRRGYTWKAWVLLAPFTCAILVAVSRSMDYRHHATDLIAGSIIGVLSAWVGYRSYYPVSSFYSVTTRAALMIEPRPSSILQTLLTSSPQGRRPTSCAPYFERELGIYRP
jgi:diacylglycerol diphosphate phosphatase/phosphatidate phosphatase